jgi:hypothetical protein
MQLQQVLKDSKFMCQQPIFNVLGRVFEVVVMLENNILFFKTMHVYGVYKFYLKILQYTYLSIIPSMR